jgi:hypothetical protein
MAVRRVLIFSGTAILLAGAVAASHDVSRDVAPADAATARQLLAGYAADAPPRTFEQEVAFISAVQDRVLDAAPVDREIPQGQSRELTQLVRAGHGLCFDRSRAIETVLRTYGFEARHAAIYSTAKTGSALKSLVTPQVQSHALSEVKTSRGWMLVDSNSRWIGLTASGDPVDLAEVPALRRARWDSHARDPLPRIFLRPYIWVYGLYSRHGRFYPPFDPVPDLNWAELTANL